MTRKNPGPAEAGSEGEKVEAADPVSILPLPSNCNTDLNRRKIFENLGLELARRGELNVSQFAATFVNFPEPVQDELVKQLRDFTRVPIEVYEAAGLLRFPARLIPLRGGRR